MAFQHKFENPSYMIWGAYARRSHLVNMTLAAPLDPQASVTI